MADCAGARTDRAGQARRRLHRLAAMVPFLVLLLAYTLSQFYRSFLAVIAPELARDIGLSPADLGNMSAIWFGAFALAQLYVGWSLDRIGPRRTMSALMLLAVAGALVLAMAQGILGCLTGMALIGLGCSPIYMGALFLFGRANDEPRFALMSSLLLGFGSAGNLLGATPLAAASQWVGWRTTFVGIALATAVSAALIALLLRDPEPIEPAPGSQGPVAGLLRIVSLRALWPFFPLTFVSYAVLLAERGLWVGPFFAEVHGLQPVARGNAVLAMAAAMSLGVFAYAATERLDLDRKWVVVIGCVSTSCLFVVLAVTGDWSVWLAVLVLALIGAAGMTYVQLIAHARRFFPPALLGRGISTMNLMFFAGAGLLQPLSGLVVSGLKARGDTPAEVFGGLHVLFGLLLAAATALYLGAQRSPR